MTSYGKHPSRVMNRRAMFSNGTGIDGFSRVRTELPQKALLKYIKSGPPTQNIVLFLHSKTRTSVAYLKPFLDIHCFDSLKSGSPVTINFLEIALLWNTK